MLCIHDRAITLNDLANSYALELRYTKAIARYKEALALYISLAKKQPTDYGIHIAHIFSNLSIIYLHLNKQKEVKEFHHYALSMHRALCKHDFSKYGIGLASCIMEGVFYLKQHSLTLYESEMILNNFRGENRAEELRQALFELKKNKVRLEF
jgi:tetratricopeptide (TPR) repeat protein